MSDDRQRPSSAPRTPGAEKPTVEAGSRSTQILRPEDVISTPASAGSSTRSPAPPQEPAASDFKRIGKYQVLRLLGRGGQAATWLAFDPDLQRHVVIKQYHATGDPQVEERVLHEGRILASVESPYVAQCYHAERQPGAVCLVVEYIEGQDLAQAHRLQPLTHREALRIVEQVAAGLGAVHSRGLLHRDLKPSNIMLDRERRPRLIDFGLAARAASRDLEEAAGTPGYMAPEQASGEHQRVGAPTDIFGLGAVLYLLLTDSPVYAGESAQEVWERARRAEIIAPRRHNPKVPRRLERICLKALAREPEDRYRSAADLAAALRKERLRPRWLAGLAAACLLVIAVAVSAWAISQGDGEEGQGAVAGSAAESPLAGELRIRVWNEPLKGGLEIGEDLGALPVREGDMLHLHARLNQPAYIYLLWLDSQGRIYPMHPWRDQAFHPLPAAQLTAELHSPPEFDRGWPMEEGASGLETVLLLARRTPLPVEVNKRLPELIGQLPSAPFQHPQEVAVWSFQRDQQGRPMSGTHQFRHRAPGQQPHEIDQALLALIQRLRSYFPVIQAVRFAYLADEAP